MSLNFTQPASWFEISTFFPLLCHSAQWLHDSCFLLNNCLLQQLLLQSLSESEKMFKVPWAYCVLSDNNCNGNSHEKAWLYRSYCRKQHCFQDHIVVVYYDTPQSAKQAVCDKLSSPLLCTHLRISPSHHHSGNIINQILIALGKTRFSFVNVSNSWQSELVRLVELVRHHLHHVKSSHWTPLWM